MPTNISVHAADLPHPIEFNLFDNVRVSLKLRKSHAHRHMVYMTLVDLEHVEVNGKKDINPVRMTNTEMMHAIGIEEEAAKPVDPNKKLSSRKKKKNNASMYEVLEKFRKLSIIENTSVNE